MSANQISLPISTPDIQQTTPNTSPAVQVSEKGKQPKKYLVSLISGVILILVILAGVYAYQKYAHKIKESSVIKPAPSPLVTAPSPTPDPTANWKTYTNNKYRFEFKYPANLALDPMGGSALLGIKLENPSMVVTFSLYDMMSGVSLYDWIVEHGPNTAVSYFPNALEIHGSKRNDYKTVEWKDYIPEENTEQRSVALSYSNLAYVFNLYKPTDNSSKTFDQIIATFKFINEWKTYNSLGNIYTFQYPPNWILRETKDTALGGVSVDVSSPNSSNKLTSEDVYSFNVGYVVYKTIPEYVNHLKELKSLSGYKTIKLGNREAVQALFPGSEQAVTMIKTFIVDRNQGYELTYGCLKDFTKIDQITDIAPDILPTFKFVE
jgi:hypothetical protein